MDKCICPDCQCDHEINTISIEFYGAALEMAKDKPYGELRLRMCNDCVKGRHGVTKTSPDSIEILKRRFANSEIDEEEFLRKRKLLSNF